MKISIKFNIKLFVGFSVLFIFGMSLSGFAQTKQESLPRNCEINGRVTDEKGKPLDFATVRIFHNKILVNGTKTDENGNYKISNVSPGKYKVHVRSIGYSSKEVTNIQLTSDSNFQLNFKLEKLQPCNPMRPVTKRFRPKMIDPSNPGRKIITKQELREMGY